MKKMLTAAVVSTLAMAGGAAQARPYGDLATVIAATPVYEQVSVPSQQCWTQTETTYVTQREVRPGPEYVVERPSGAGAVLGAIVGGVVGHQFGNSNRGRDHATVAGAVVGGLLGNHIERENGPGYTRVASPVAYTRQVPVARDVQRCRTVNDVRNLIAGYDVRYEYHGRQYSTRLPYEPGRTLRVNVDVHPYGHRPSPLRPVYVR